MSIVEILDEFRADCEDALEFFVANVDKKGYCLNFGDLGVSSVGLTYWEADTLIDDLPQLICVVEEGNCSTFDSDLTNLLNEKWEERGYWVSVRSEW